MSFAFWRYFFHQFSHISNYAIIGFRGWLFESLPGNKKLTLIVEDSMIADLLYMEFPFIVFNLFLKINGYMEVIVTVEFESIDMDF